MKYLALSKKFNATKTIDNYNNVVGLPYTILQVKREHEFGVIEIGVRHSVEMQFLSKLAKVKYAVITNIGSAHIGFFKSKTNTMYEKLHIIDYFDKDSILFLNGDDKLLRSLNYELKDIKKIWYGTHDYCDYRAQNIHLLKNGTTFECLMHNVCKKVFIPTVWTKYGSKRCCCTSSSSQFKRRFRLRD